MPSISRIYGYYVHDLSEYQQMIGQEMQKVDPTAIVSIDEFIEVVLKPALSRKAFLGSQLRPLNRRIEKTLFYWSDHKDVESFKIKEKMIPDDLQLMMSQRPISSVGKTKILSEIRDMLNEEDEKRGITKAGRIYPALYVGKIIHAINRVAGSDTYLFDTMSSSVWRGDGLGALKFWRDVNSLKDYSANFPNKIKLQGNKRDDNPDKGFLGDLIPSGSGWQPA